MQHAYELTILNKSSISIKDYPLRVSKLSSSSDLLEGILEHMKKVYNMWRMTRDLEKETLKFHKAHVPRKFLEIDEQKFVAAVFVQDFAIRKKMTDQQALNLLEQCENKGYIEVLPRDRISVLRVSQDGDTDLTDSILRFPIGLIEAEWEKHGRFISGFIVGLVIPAVAALIKWTRP